MTYKQAFDAKKFQNPRIANLVQAIVDAEHDFAAARAERSLSGILISLTQAFPTEKAGIQPILQGKSQRATTTSTHQGGASVRFVDPSKKKLTPIRPISQPIVLPAEPEKEEEEGSEDTSGETVSFTNPKTGEEVEVPVVKKEPGPVEKKKELNPYVANGGDLDRDSVATGLDKVNGITPKMVMGCKDKKELMALFSGNAHLFERFFEVYGLERGNTRSVTGYANKLWKHYNQAK